MPPKRKQSQPDGPADEVQQPRRSTRQRTSTAAAAAAAREPAPPAAATPKKEPTPLRKKKTATTPGAKKKKPKARGEEEDAEDGTTDGQEKVAAAPKAEATRATAAARTGQEARQYWLMKAEPESRFDNGVDVRFSIDDLAAKREPEPWDGIRNFVARNNLRAMRKGDLAFFYHSNCKEPGIAGTMEVVREHSPDLTAHDPKCPYYDPKSKPDDPRWSVVHVEFRSKFAVPIGLKELRALGGAGGPLRDMQVLRQSRLSVSRVSADEWGFLVGLAEEKARAQGV